MQDQLVMSDGYAASKGVQAILLENVPSALQVQRAHTTNDRRGTDWWVECNQGQHLSVDCKIRAEDFAAKNPDSDDLALETWSVVEQQIVGWTRDHNKRTDYVLWHWQDTGRWALVPFPMLCAVFSRSWQHWSALYKTARQRTNRNNGSHYHSECVFVPRRVIWASIYEQYSGALVAQESAA